MEQLSAAKAEWKSNLSGRRASENQGLKIVPACSNSHSSETALEWTTYRALKVTRRDTI